MYYCGYAAEDLIKEIEHETNSSFPVSKEIYCNMINEAEQLIYSEIVREQTISEIDYAESISVYNLPVDSITEDIPRIDDIYSVFYKGDNGIIELEKTTPERYLRGVQEDNSYYLSDDKISANINKASTANDKLIIIRLARPSIKRVIGDKVIGTIALPEKFIDLMRCKLRSDKYRLMNEDELCAKWADKYNYHLENFKVFVEARRPTL